MSLETLRPWPAPLWWLLGQLFRLPVPWQQQAAMYRWWRTWFPHVDILHPRLLDVLRIPLQALWLLLVIPPQARKPWPKVGAWLRRLEQATLGVLVRIFSTENPGPVAKRLHRVMRNMVEHPLWDQRWFRWPMLLLGLAGAVLVVTVPYELETQLWMLLALLLAALLIRRIPGRMPTLVLMAISLLASTRYLWWRYTTTLNWDDSLDLVLGLILVAVETYAWLVLLLGYVQTAWPLQREPVPLPEDESLWPSVDVYIPTYNEPLHVLKPTVLAAQQMDWPTDKLNVYILDDGKREEIRRFAEEVGVQYLDRPDNRHAKAGNLNHALTKTRGEFIAIFDCDHIPTRSFLQTSMGWFFKDRKLALVQTPHHFFSPDPFERNLGTFGQVPNENELFYGLVQDGNDLWNATFFCGSCAVLRRGPLEEVGGIAVETVTEDAHTALKMHRLGYRSAYLSQPQAAGLATESLSAHVGQRIRWARGMTQIFRIDNPMLGKGLNPVQRLCYSNAMLHFLYGIPRLVFLTAPLAFLLLHAYFIHASAVAIVLYVVPHIFHANLTNSRIQGKYRHSFWAEVYETALAWYIARPTTVALIDPGKGSFNVTAKGGLVEKEHFDWTISRPYLVVLLLNLLGVAFGLWRLQAGDPREIPTVIITLLWTLYNLLILGAVLAVAAEARQVRVNHRVGLDVPVTLILPGQHRVQTRTVDVSEGGIGVELPEKNLLSPGQKLQITLFHGTRPHVFPVVVANVFGHRAGLRFDRLDVEQEEALIHCTFSRADAWLDRDRNRKADNPVESLGEIFSTGLRGYGALLRHVFPLLAEKLPVLERVRHLLWQMLPRHPEYNERMYP